MRNKKSEFGRKMESALHPRRCKHHVVKRKARLASPHYTSNLGAVVGEVMDGVKAARIQSLDSSVKSMPALGDGVHAPVGSMLGVVQGGAQLMGKLAVAAVLDACEMGSRARRSSREKGPKRGSSSSEPTAQQLRRRKYYARETAVRQAAAARLRAARPKPLHPMPTPEQLIHAYALRHVSEMDAIRFGELMIDLDEHAQIVLTHKGNKIVGSNGGVRKWLSENCPELAAHYDTCQRFKRRAQDDPDFGDEDEA